MSVKILAVDDSDTMREMVKETLDMGGYTVVMAVDGVDGLKKFSEHSDIGLVIADINMPNLNGIEMIREMRKINTEVPILTLTTESEDNMKQKGKEAGADGWIVKPFRPPQFLDIIKQILES